MSVKLSNAEKIQKGKELKDKGNQHFKNGEIQVAIRSYHESLLYLSGLVRPDKQDAVPFVSGSSGQAPLTDTEKEDARSAIVAVYNNMCACHIKKSNWKRAIETSNKVLEFDPKNPKGHYRRGLAYLNDGALDKAEKDLKKALELSPGDGAVIKELHTLREKQKLQDEKQRREFAGMFDRARK
ncbi:hypothetical protein BKA69DRAFT_893650 [Paraphysoderma sedebokerense]|nr:hypothetical protein BKA69DRAFT_893650 [Paraphysoderma sedebokerense]